ncbi:hypothetical protein FJ365_01580 [Candidatus Dependentiae bacterium]|nr:hypothetical protein [Candidatus Dependentiae bacterium]
MKRIVLLALFILAQRVYAVGDVATDAYSKITDGLISLRKQFPAIQPKVYALLDQVEKLYKVAKASSNECVELKKKLAEGLQESKLQLASAKKTFEQSKMALTKQFEEQQQRLLALEKQRDVLLAKSTVKNEVQGGEVKKA